MIVWIGNERFRRPNPFWHNRRQAFFGGAAIARFIDVGRDSQQLLAHPEAVAIPLAQFESKGILVAEVRGKIVGFAAMVGGRMVRLS